MSLLTSILTVVHLFAAVTIVALVLLQQGKGADMGAAFWGWFVAISFRCPRLEQFPQSNYSGAGRCVFRHRPQLGVYLHAAKQCFEKRS